MKALDAFDLKKLFNKKADDFQPSTYALKLREKIENAKND